MVDYFGRRNDMRVALARVAAQWMLYQEGGPALLPSPPVSPLGRLPSSALGLAIVGQVVGLVVVTVTAPGLSSTPASGVPASGAGLVGRHSGGVSPIPGGGLKRRPVAIVGHLN